MVQEVVQPGQTGFVHIPKGADMTQRGEAVTDGLPGFDADALRCEQCGGTEFDHIAQQSDEGEPRWFNRCRACRAVSEFMPSQEEIRTECLRIRAEQGTFEVDDGLERYWRRHHAALERTDEEEVADESDMAA